MVSTAQHDHEGDPAGTAWNKPGHGVAVDESDVPWADGSVCQLLKRRDRGGRLQSLMRNHAVSQE